ncbi:DBP [Bat mastadenovirus WIV11]|uniref:DNA-binding protein n=1 Tax=Bat mastadenovirus WIV11 TaxID=1788433 RepID=A0A163HL19_9ADEN|nr:DBP [Bat mastadenovirus WIV11]AMB43126.1 DBP [Bat mastadenovirus WIV11]
MSSQYPNARSIDAGVPQLSSDGSDSDVEIPLPPKKRGRTPAPLKQRRKQTLTPKRELSSSESENEELVVDEVETGAARGRSPPPAGPSKAKRPTDLKLHLPDAGSAPRPQYSENVRWEFSDDSDGEPDNGVGIIGFSNPPVKIVHRPDGTVKHKIGRKRTGSPVETGPPLPPRTPSPGRSGEPKAKRINMEAAVPPPPQALDAQEQMWQQAMDLAVNLCVPLKVDVKELTLLPDAGTLECLRKAAHAWIQEKKICTNLTFSTQKSLQTLMARFLLDFIMRSSGLTSNVNITGCAIWEHGCTDGQGLRCLHGVGMLNKDHVIEMDVNSENGQRALKEQPTKTKITTNRWGRNVVQLKNEEARCCLQDASAASGLFTSQSCGMFYSEGPKAEDAFKQIMALQQACYPKMPGAGRKLLMPIKCDCNWGQAVMPLLGRQVCKLTPFALSSAANVDRTLVQDPKLLATLEHPNILVFQCCNPVYRNSKASAQKNCDFKLSAPDVMTALQLAKQMWQSCMEKQAPVCIPEFRWSPEYQYQNTLLPMTHASDDADECLF